MNRILLLLCTTVIFSSCFPGKKTVTLEPVTVSAKAGSTEYRATAPRIWDITHTTVALTFNLPEKIANGRTWLKLHPYAYAQDSIVLDAKSMAINAVMMEDENGKKLPFDYSKDVLTIHLGKTYYTKDTIQLFISYKAMPYATQAGGSKAITEDRGLYFINTDHKIQGKPVQVWTQGETESNSHWMPTFDKPNERFTVRLELTLPDSFETLGNGYLSSQVRAGKGLRTDTWVMDKPIQAYAAMFATGNFAIVKDASWKGREINYYVEPAYAPYAKDMFRNTPEMMEYFSKVTGVNYPWNKYSQVVVRDYVSGAMENTTATLFGEFINETSREIIDIDYEDIVSHELFHQWFGDYVTAESWSNLTVNESFANYGEQLWRRYKYGNASADKLAYDDLWKFLSIENANTSPPLVRFRYASREDMFDRISYEKGGAILNYMHGLMGDSAFFKAMNIYLTKNALQSTEATHWRMAVEEATGKDWNWFFRQWYYRGGYPKLNVEYSYDDAAKQLQVTVTQKQDSLYTLPLKTQVIYGNNSTIQDWNLANRTERFTYPYQNGMRPVIVPDVTNWLVGTIKEDKEPRDWLVQFENNKDNWTARHNAIIGVRNRLEDDNAQKLINLALKDKERNIRSYTLNTLALQTAQKWQDKWKADAAFMAVNDPSTKVRAAAFTVLGNWKVGSSRQDMLDALADSSYSVSGAALLSLNKLKDDTAYILAKQVLNDNPGGWLRYNAWEIIGQKGNKEDVALFEQQAPYINGNIKLNMESALSTYITHTADIPATERAADVFVQLVETESIGVYRLAGFSFLMDAAKEYEEMKDNARKNAEKADAQQHLDILKKAADRMATNEPDEDRRNEYRKMMKGVFGG